METVRIVETAETRAGRRGRPDSCINNHDWMHSHTCKVPACVAFYKAIGAVTKAEREYENSKKK